ncbi:hypothetical protein BOSEA31B_13046 [Hyphomicrobiales bacterium]|nr:hypothetical protein BOSEA31B_13046 [Hyphomicrobiales bacterium]CAH1698818.1 hypothetical protein BOSEA1005_11871 [Hyphomicrobiales bacterium]CAI0342464.1 hypothetical protein BO1005MUT1_180243 [Hyphomicrobiales bacterium]
MSNLQSVKRWPDLSMAVGNIPGLPVLRCGRRTFQVHQIAQEVPYGDDRRQCIRRLFDWEPFQRRDPRRSRR